MDIKNAYFVKKTSDNDWKNITTLFDGVRVLSITGLGGSVGKAKNVYTADWEYTHAETFDIVMQDSTETKRIIRENVDVKVTFAVRRKYASSSIDVQTVHDNFVSYMTSTDVWIKSLYTGKTAHCVCEDGYEPTMLKLQRGNNSFAMGTITLHCLDKPQANT